MQSCHAAIEATRCGLISPDIIHPHLVLIGVKDELRLFNCTQKLDQLGIAYRSFVEPDLDNQLTAVATAPISGDLRHHFKKYQLLRFKQNLQEVA